MCYLHAFLAIMQALDFDTASERATISRDEFLAAGGLMKKLGVPLENAEVLLRTIDAEGAGSAPFEALWDKDRHRLLASLDRDGRRLPVKRKQARKRTESCDCDFEPNEKPKKCSIGSFELSTLHAVITDRQSLAPPLQCCVVSLHVARLHAL